jgi:putative hydrolase
MILYADYHTHTTYSGDGKGTMEENVQAAIAKGLKVLAISDHGPGHMGYGIKYKQYPKMREELDALQEKYPQIKLLLGIEANVMDEAGHLDIDEKFLKYNDILLAGYHFGSSPKAHLSDVKIHWYNMMSRKSAYYYKKAQELNTKAFMNAIENYPIHILTHPGAKGPAHLADVAKVAFARGTALEINNSHGHLTYEEILEVKDSGCMFSINSDAHRPEHIGSFSNGIERASRAGITEERILNARLDLIEMGKK